LDARFLSFLGLGVLGGSFLAIQCVLNTSLAKQVGTVGPLVVLTVVGLGLTLISR